MDRHEYAKQQALVARERALQSNEVGRQEWLKVAELWDAIAHEYRELAKIVQSADSSTAA